MGEFDIPSLVSYSSLYLQLKFLLLVSDYMSG